MGDGSMVGGGRCKGEMPASANSACIKQLFQMLSQTYRTPCRQRLHPPRARPAIPHSNPKDITNHHQLNPISQLHPSVTPGLPLPHPLGT